MLAAAARTNTRLDELISEVWAHWRREDPSCVRFTTAGNRQAQCHGLWPVRPRRNGQRHGQRQRCLQYADQPDFCG